MLLHEFSYRTIILIYKQSFRKVNTLPTTTQLTSGKAGIYDDNLSCVLNTTFQEATQN